MVAGEHHHGALGDSRLLQPLEQVGHGLLQLQLAGDVGAKRLRARKIRHQPFILDAHGIVGEVIIGMTGIGHIVGVKLRLLEVVVHGLFHHLQVRRGRAGLHVQAEVQGFEGIAHVGVGVDAVIEGAHVVVIGVGRKPLIGVDVPQAEGQIVLHGHGKAHAAHVRHESHAQGILAVGSEVGEAIIEVFKDEALLAHAVEGGRQVRVDEIVGKGLGTDHDEVISRKIAGIVVLCRA